jgi:hypothetical protein
MNKEVHFLNPVSQLYLMAPQRVKVQNIGRGGGKSYSNGVDIAQDLKLLPRAKGLFLGLTYSQILSNTLLPVCSALEAYGYYRDVDYVIGKRPPGYFRTPWQKPEKYDNVMTFWNGYTLILASFDRPQLLRGGSNDFAKVDEALLVNKDKYDEVIVPTLRPSHIMLKDKPRMLHEHFTTSMPYGNLGSWIFDIEEKSKTDPKSFYYIEGSSWDNVDILGEETILNWKSSMTKTRYEIEVLGKRIRNVGDLFYPNLTDRHFYDFSDDADFLDSFEYDLEAIRRFSSSPDSRMDIDVNSTKPLDLSFDFGTFSCMWVGQMHGDDYLLVNSFFVKSPDTVNELVDKFCQYYQYHKNKVVFVYGDKGGKRRDERSYENTFQLIQKRFKEKGWVMYKKKTADINHWDRHLFISEVMEENPMNRHPKIRINRMKNKDAIISLQSAGMLPDRQKDKSSEKKAIAQEHATHFSDAFDYLIYHKFKSMKTLDGLY